MRTKPNPSPGAAALRRHAEDRMRKQPSAGQPAAAALKALAEPWRLLHELQVHQIELEMQNAELHESRDRMEALLEKYTDLYDFSPVGYISLTEQGRIAEVNLTGATLLGVERSRVIGWPLSRFVALPSRPLFLDFLKRVFGETGKQSCEAKLQRDDGTPFWANLHGLCSNSPGGLREGCRIAVSDITSLKLAQEAQRRMEALSVVNQELKLEIVKRQAVEEALKASDQKQHQLLDQARHMQSELRSLSHRILQVQEEERRRISRELHDEITQVLVSINVHLEALALSATINPSALKLKVAQTQQLVEKSVNIVHQFARDLRPTSLDDLGLIITLHSFLSEFLKQTGIRVHFTAFAEVDQLNSDRCTVLYRIVHSALTNVAQHAHASRVAVSLAKVAKGVLLEISDNGKAFDVERVLHAKRNQRLGLIGMRERAEMVGGTFTVDSVPGTGTTVRVQIPFKKVRRSMATHER